jgi:esterase/lipase
MMTAELEMDATLTSQLMKSLFSKGSVIALNLAGGLAFRLFSKPWSAPTLSEREKAMALIGKRQLSAAKKFRVLSGRYNVRAYHFANRCRAGTVILVHGWTSQASHMAGLVTPLIDQGFSVVCFDLPAHGESSGMTTNIVDCAKALQSVASLSSDIHGVVAHSFGGPVTGLALTEGPSGNPVFDVKKIALLASPNANACLTRAFGDAIGLQGQAQSDFEAEFEALCDCQLDHFTGSKYFSRIDRPMLVLHVDNDCEISQTHGLRYGDLGRCDFVSLKNVGHRDILYVPEVGERIGRFMAS